MDLSLAFDRIRQEPVPGRVTVQEVGVVEPPSWWKALACWAENGSVFVSES